MGVKYVKDFAFPSAGGFHSGSVQRYAKGGHVTKLPAKAKDSAKGMPARAKPNAPARGAPKMESKPKVGKGQGYAEGGPVAELDAGQPDYVPSRARAAQVNASAPREDIGDIIGVVGGLTPLPEEPIYRKRISPALEREDVGAIIGVAPEAPRYLRPEPVDRVAARRAAMMERAGARRMGRVPAFKKGGAVKGEKIAKVMREYKEGKLHSGSKKGPVVKNPKQAMAIALSEARAAKKAKGGEIFSDEYMAYESKGPKTRYTAAKGRRMSKERAMERRALDKARHAEKYAPGLSLDMSEYKKGGKVKHSDVKMDKAMVKKAVHKHEKAMHPGKKMTKLNKGGVPSYGRKPMYGGGKC